MGQPDFLNVDLEIISESSDLLKLAADMEEKAVVLYAGNGNGDDDYLVRMESNEDTSDQEVVIHNLCDLGEGFSKEQKAVWDGAKSRLFDVGYDQNPEQFGTHFRINKDSLRRIAALNADLGISVYRTDDDRK